MRPNETPKDVSQVNTAWKTELSLETQVRQDFRDPLVFLYIFLPVSLII